MTVESTLIRYRAVILQLVPRWLRKGSEGAGIAGKFLYAIGINIDASADALVAGVKRRFPGYNGQYDSLPAIGADRRMARGPSELDASYAARLLTWLGPQGHPTRGGPYAMLTQLYGYWQGTFAMTLVYRTGAAFAMSTSGVITRTTIGNPWPLNTTEQAHWRLFFDWPGTLTTDGLWGDPGVWGDGGIWGSNITPLTVSQCLLVPTEWNTATAIGHVALLPHGTYVDPSHWFDPGLVSIPVY